MLLQNTVSSFIALKLDRVFGNWILLRYRDRQRVQLNIDHGLSLIVVAFKEGTTLFDGILMSGTAQLCSKYVNNTIVSDLLLLLTVDWDDQYEVCLN